MNLDERKNAIGEWLKKILGQYVRPAHLEDEEARVEIAHMMVDLNSEWPLCNPEQFQAIGERFWSEVRRGNPGRQWPTIGLMVKALNRAKSEPAPAITRSADPRNEPPHIYDMVLDWWQEHGTPFPTLAKKHHATRMVNDGVATAIDLHEAGFPAPKGFMALVNACDTDTQHNQQVRADLRNMGIKRMEAAE